MNKIKLITDSCCSLTKQQLADLDIDYMAMDITVGENTFNSFDAPEKDPEKFYEILEKADKCSTSCINTFTFAEMFEKYVKDGFDVVYVGLSGGMSCTNANALAAAMDLNEKYGKHVWVADSITGSYGIALQLLRAHEMLQNGSSAEEIYNALDHNNMGVYAIFAPGDLKFLKRSGRISRFVASIGTMLKIVPVITANEKGELKLFAKAIGRKKAINTIEKYFLEQADRESPQKVYIGHTGQKEEAEKLAEFVKNNSQNKEIIVDYIDFTMGCNCGPKTLAIFGFLKK